MTRKALIISHPNRLEMERQYLKGVSVTKISKEFGVSEPALRYHCLHHISRQLSTAMAIKDSQDTLDLWTELDSIVSMLKTITKRNFDEGRDIVALKGLSGSVQACDLLFRASAYHHQTKLLELEQSREQDTGQANEEMEQAIKILTMDELDVFFKISQKLETQDETIDVLAGYTKAGTYIHPEEDRPLTRRKPLKRQEIELIETDATEEPVQEVTKPDHPLKVKPVNSVEIGYTPWDEHPLNPKYHLRMERERWDKKNMKRIP